MNTPRLPDDSVNLSPKKPMLQLLQFVAVSIVLAAVLYACLGMVSAFWISNLSTESESRLRGKLAFAEFFKSSLDAYKDEHLTSFVHQLVQATDHASLNPTAWVYCSEIPNAMAFPSGDIYISSALLDHFEYENDLAMVLGHEIGHFVGRDHLKGVSRDLLWSILTSSLTSQTSNTAFVRAGNLMSLKFSRDQENDADLVGIHILNRFYGHVGGFDTFFSMIANQEFPALKEKKHNEPPSWASTHPNSADRILTLQDYVQDNNFKVDNSALVPMQEAFQPRCDEDASTDSEQSEKTKQSPDS